MGKDLRDVYEEKRTYLEKYISKNKLTSDQKEVLLVAIEFGSAASDCKRVSMARGEEFQSMQYGDGLEKMKNLLK